MCASQAAGVLLSPEHSTYPDATSLLCVLLSGEPIVLPGYPSSLTGCSVTIVLCNFQSGNIHANSQSLLERCFSFRSSIFNKPRLSELQFYFSLE